MKTPLDRKHLRLVVNRDTRPSDYPPPKLEPYSKRRLYLIYFGVAIFCLGAWFLVPWFLIKLGRAALSR